MADAPNALLVAAVPTEPNPGVANAADGGRFVVIELASGSLLVAVDALWPAAVLTGIPTRSTSSITCI